MAGFAIGKRYAATGEPYCRGCRKVIWNARELDATEENMHFECAEIKREEQRRKESAVPPFKTQEEIEYRRIETREWYFLYMPW